MKYSTKSPRRASKPKCRVYIPLPDHRNVARGTEWLRKMIEASEQKENMDKVVDEMVPVVKRDREPGEEG